MLRRLLFHFTAVATANTEEEPLDESNAFGEKRTNAIHFSHLDQLPFLATAVGTRCAGVLRAGQENRHEAEAYLHYQFLCILRL